MGDRRARLLKPAPRIPSPRDQAISACQADLNHAEWTGADDGITGSLEDRLHQLRQMTDDQYMKWEHKHKAGEVMPPIYKMDPESEIQHYLSRASRIADDAIQLHLSKAADYGDTGDHLGIKGQYAELWRKIGKLKGPMWDGKKLAHEQPIEILQDLIGHCIKAIDYYQQEEKK